MAVAEATVEPAAQVIQYKCQFSDNGTQEEWQARDKESGENTAPALPRVLSPGELIRGPWGQRLTAVGKDLRSVNAPSAESVAPSELNWRGRGGAVGPSGNVRSSRRSRSGLGLAREAAKGSCPSFRPAGRPRLAPCERLRHQTDLERTERRKTPAKGKKSQQVGARKGCECYREEAHNHGREVSWRPGGNHRRDRFESCFDGTRAFHEVSFGSNVGPNQSIKVGPDQSIKDNR